MTLRGKPRLSALLYYAAITVAAVVGTIAAAVLAGRKPDPAWAWFLKCIVIFLLVATLTWAFMKREGYGWKRYGVSGESSVYRLALAGFAAGIALACAWAAIVWCWQPYGLHPNPAFSLRAFLLGTLATIFIGAAEETGYRSYGLDRLEHGFGPDSALLLSSILFAAMHTTGGMPWLAAICVVGSCGVLYGTLMLATRSVPLVAAFHIANNLTQDALLRTSDGSLFALSPVALPGPAAHTTGIWLCMMAVNLALALVIWRKRRPALPA